jgi:glutaredoxin-like protein NrdH
MPDQRGSIPGSHDHHQVMFYGLSTCIWCKRTRQFLESQDVKFDYVYVDLLQGQERKEVIEQIRSWNPAVSFPTIVVDDSQSVVGYKTDELKEVLEL